MVSPSTKNRQVCFSSQQLVLPETNDHSLGDKTVDKRIQQIFTYFGSLATENNDENDHPRGGHGRHTR